MPIKNKLPRPKGRVIPSRLAEATAKRAGKFVSDKVPTSSEHRFIPPTKSRGGVFVFVENKLYYVKKESQEGAVLLVASLLIMAVLLMIFFGVSFSLTKELKMFESLQKSPLAYCAADSGAERILYDLKKGYSPPGPFPMDDIINFTLGNGSSYQVIAPAAKKFKSIGSIDDISRAIELSYE